MDRTSIDWHGPMVAVVTNFKQDGAIDSESFSVNVERMFALDKVD